MAVATGTRLLKPKACTEELYRLMRRMWSFEPNGRPSMEQVHDEIRAQIAKLEVASSAGLFPSLSALTIFLAKGYVDFMNCSDGAEAPPLFQGFGSLVEEEWPTSSGRSNDPSVYAVGDNSCLESEYSLGNSGIVSEQFPEYALGDDGFGCMDTKAGRPSSVAAGYLDLEGTSPSKPLGSSQDQGEYEYYCYTSADFLHQQAICMI